MRNKHTKGFTLIELLVVIAIIGLLAAIVLIALNLARVKARDAKRAGDIRQLETALQSYFIDNGDTYPIQTTAATTIPGLTPTYLATIPTAPLPGDTATCLASTTGGIQNDYLYSSSAAGDTFALTFCLGSGAGDFGAGIHTADENGIH